MTEHKDKRGKSVYIEMDDGTHVVPERYWYTYLLMREVTPHKVVLVDKVRDLEAVT